MAIQQKRIVALLDVDNTLIFGIQGAIEYNNNLIDNLLKNKVKDIYLFSSMRLKQSTVDERKALVQHLESKGLTVHGAICAADLVWNKDKELLKEFVKEVNKNPTDQVITTLLNQKKFESLNHFNDAESGQAFKVVSADGLSEEDAQLYQDAATIIRSYLDNNRRSDYSAQIKESEKSYLYEMFVNKKPQWAGAVIFIDDVISNISAVGGMHKQLNPEHKLLAILNKDEKRQVKNTQNFYQAFIQSFVEKAYALFNAFNSYTSERRLSHSTAKKEILERLQLALENCKFKEQVALVKNNFDKEYQQLNQHRFSFWSNAKTRSALVFDNMIEKREEQIEFQ